MIEINQYDRTLDSLSSWIFTRHQSVSYRRQLDVEWIYPDWNRLPFTTVPLESTLENSIPFGNVIEDGKMWWIQLDIWLIRVFDHQMGENWSKVRLPIKFSPVWNRININRQSGWIDWSHWTEEYSWLQLRAELIKIAISNESSWLYFVSIEKSSRKVEETGRI